MRRGLGVTKSLSESTEVRGCCLETRSGRETGFQKTKQTAKEKHKRWWRLLVEAPCGLSFHTGSGFLGRQGSLAASLASFKFLYSIHASGVTGPKLLLKFIYCRLEEN